MFNIIGKSNDGKLVVTGVYRVYETHGVPLDIIFETLRNKNIVPDWKWFMIEGIEAGINEEHLLAKIDIAVSDVFGSEFRDKVVLELKKFLKKEKKNGNEKEGSCS